MGSTYKNSINSKYVDLKIMNFQSFEDNLEESKKKDEEVYGKEKTSFHEKLFDLKEKSKIFIPKVEANKFNQKVININLIKSELCVKNVIRMSSTTQN